MRWIAASLIFSLALPALGQAGPASVRYGCFGDSITAGDGDTENVVGVDAGYPTRLATLFEDAGIDAIVLNHGLGGEETPEGLTRLRGVLFGLDVLLLMEGTNDISREISRETTIFNLIQMANLAARNGVSTVHATLIPRIPRARIDPGNVLNLRIVHEIRSLAGANGRGLVDPFEVFLSQGDGLFHDYYWDLPNDRVGHPNPEGYDLMAQAFFDVLTETDTVPPVVGIMNPLPGELRVAPTEDLDLRLWDLIEGTDLANTELLINGDVVDAEITGSARQTIIHWSPSPPWRGVVEVGLRSQDRAAVPNTVDRTITTFVARGTTLLPGDIDRDGDVDGRDLLLFAPRFGTQQGSQSWNPDSDINGDHRVDGADLALLASNFGESVN